MKKKQKIRLAEVYKSLSDNQRQAFWNSAINIFLVIFTFWLGLTVQFIVVSTNKSYNDELIKLQYFDKLKEDRERLNLVLSLRDEIDLIQGDTKERIKILSDSILFQSEVLKYFEIEDSILNVCEHLRWHVKSKTKLKQFDDSLAKCLVDVRISSIFLSSTSVEEVATKIHNHVASEESRKRFGYSSKKEKNTTINNAIETAKKYYNSTLLQREYLIIDAMAEYNSTVRSITDLLKEEMAEYSSSKFINTIHDLSHPFTISVLLLVLCIGISIPIASLILKRMHVSTTERGFTKEEYESMQKDKDDRYGALKDKYDDLYGRYLKVLDELDVTECNND